MAMHGNFKNGVKRALNGGDRTPGIIVRLLSTKEELKRNIDGFDQTMRAQQRKIVNAALKKSK